MKAKKVYEFKRTRKQGLSNQTELGITIYRKKKLEEWFEKYAAEYNKYEIKDDLSVEISDTLFIYKQDLTYIPGNLNIGRTLIINQCPNLEKIEDNIYVKGGLSIENSPKLKELPENFIIHRPMHLSNLSISKIPSSLFFSPEIIMNRQISLSYLPNLTELPDNLEVQKLKIENTGITELPKKLIVRQELRVKDNHLDKLPDDLIVFGNLILNNTGLTIKDLPKTAQIHGFVSIY